MAKERVKLEKAKELAMELSARARQAEQSLAEEQAKIAFAKQVTAESEAEEGEKVQEATNKLRYSCALVHSVSLVPA